MDQIQSTQNVNLQSPMLAKTVQAEPKAVTPPEIKDGDNKSMQYLKYAGAALGAAAIVLTACKMMKGKTPEIDAKWFDLDALKKGEAVLTKEGKEEAAKLAKKCSGISKDGKIGDIKIKQADGDNTFTYIFKDGKRTQIDKAIVKDGKTKNISQIFNDKGKITKSIVDGKEVTLEYYGNGKLAKSTKDGVTTVYEYATIGTGDKAKEKLIRKTIGDKVTTFKYNSDNGRIAEKILPDENVVSYSYGKVGDKTVLAKIEDANSTVAQEYAYHDNGKLKSFIKSVNNNDNITVNQVDFDEQGNRIVAYNTSLKPDNAYGEVATKDSKFLVNASKKVNPENGHPYGAIQIDNNNVKAEIQTDVKDGNLIFRYIDDKGTVTEFDKYEELLEANKTYFEKCSKDDMDLLLRMIFGWNE